MADGDDARRVVGVAGGGEVAVVVGLHAARRRSSSGAYMARSGRVTPPVDLDRVCGDSSGGDNGGGDGGGGDGGGSDSSNGRLSFQN